MSKSILVLSPGVKCVEYEGDDLTPSNDEVQKSWGCTSTTLQAFMSGQFEIWGKQ